MRLTDITPLIKAYYDECENTDCRDCPIQVRGCEDMVQILMRLPIVEPKTMQWTPCSEGLPKKAGDYLVTTHSGQVARYIYMGTDSSKEYWMRCVAAWMPLPKPWKGEPMGDIIRCKSCVWYDKGVCLMRLDPKTPNSCCPEWIPKGRRTDGR